jgi:SET domain-containing protein
MLLNGPMTNAALYVGGTINKGRGVFTKEKIKKKTIVETSPVIVMSAADRILLDQTLLHDYIFEWQPGDEQMCCMALGWVPLYNHSYRSNCEYFMNYEEGIIYIQTMRNIDAGEELTINYNGVWNEKKPVWFDVK